MTKCAVEMRMLGIGQQAEWMEVLGAVAQHDFYHLPGYHSLAESRGEGTARLFVYKEEDYTLALPLLLRPVDTVAGLGAEAKGMQDATSVYGYAGPIASHCDIPETVLANFRESLAETLAGIGVVAVFSRLHPVIEQRGILAGLGESVLEGETVSIDLTLPGEIQRLQFRSDHKRGINKALRAGMTALEDTEFRHLDDFLDIYAETMRRVNAAGYYFFERGYFDELIAKGGVHLFVALLDGKVAAGALCMVCDCIVQYHLGGTRDAYLGLAPMKLLFETARVWGVGKGFKVFHLGGGVGSHTDSLFHFKAGFSDRRHPFFTWRWVLDSAACERLCEEKARWNAGHGLRNGASGFFPPYRAPGVPIEESAR